MFNIYPVAYNQNKTMEDVDLLTSHFIVGLIVALCSGIAIGSALNIYNNKKNE